jgi:dUTPase
VAYALDNARLLDELQRRAAREQSIGEISTKISEANDIDSILRSTVEELGRKLINLDVAIQISDQAGI